MPHEYSLFHEDGLHVPVKDRRVARILRRQTRHEKGRAPDLAFEIRESRTPISAGGQPQANGYWLLATPYSLSSPRQALIAPDHRKPLKPQPVNVPPFRREFLGFVAQSFHE
jgi:hypothetical protein